MDMSFANQALCVEHLALHGASLAPRVLPVPGEIDREVARLKLASLGIEIDELTAAAARVPDELAQLKAGATSRRPWLLRSGWVSGS